MRIDESKITRVEVITPKGREFSKWDCKIKMVDIQDEGRTLKIFLEDKGKVQKLTKKSSRRK